MARQPLFEHLVIGCRRRGGEGVAERLELVPGHVEIVAAERDMLNPLAIKGAQIFPDLALAARALLVERDADLAVGGGHRLRRQTGIFAVYAEIIDLAEARAPPIGTASVRDSVFQYG